MFSKGSRYQNLSESSPVDAEGERLLGKDVRQIPRTTGAFSHTVREADRLDLLAFKYYGDAAKWWHISDANAGATFPTDLLDPQPVVVDRIALAHAGFVKRFHQLIGAVEQLTARLNPSCQFLPLESLREFNESQLNSLQATLAVLYSQPHFLSSTIVVVFPPSGSIRSEILQEIKHHGFHLQGATGWNNGSAIVAVFNITDLGVAQGWRETVDDLSAMTGVLSVQTNILECAIELAYNSALVDRTVILRKASGRGFELQASRLSRLGTNIVIPPNQIV